MASLAAEAKCGRGGSCGGGDGRAIEMIQAMEYVCEFIQYETQLHRYLTPCLEEVRDLWDSVHSPERTARVYSAPDETVNDDGIDKLAYTDKDRTVRIASKRWDQTLHVGVILLTASAEIGWLLKIEEPYKFAKEFGKSSVFQRAVREMWRQPEASLGASVFKEFCVLESKNRTDQPWIEFFAGSDGPFVRRVFDGAVLRILNSRKLPFSDEVGLEVRVITNKRPLSLIPSPADAQPNEFLRYHTDLLMLCRFE